MLVPLIWLIGQHLPRTPIYPGHGPDRGDDAAQIFRGYVRFIGVGAIATAGIFGIIKSLDRGASFGDCGARSATARRRRSAPIATSRIMKILIGVVVAAVAVAVFFGDARRPAVSALVGLC